MKFSENWLREWVETKTATDEICHQLTMSGLELESIEDVCQFTNVVVAQVDTCEKHPNADKLSLCQVNDGTEVHQVICGAANVRQGLKVALARVGAKLPGITIKKAKLRDVESFGMLCSEVELSLAEKAKGIMELPEEAPLGQSLAEYFDLNDRIIDLAITPNRGDAISMRGVAREVAVLTNGKVSEPEVKTIKSTCDDQRKIHLHGADACPKYVGRIIKGIDNTAQSPMWLKERLRRSGIRSISPVVDVTNYVMLEFGPMHAFDLAKVEGDIHVRYAKEGEELALLDESTIKCDVQTLLIADDKKALALAGIMGGEQSGVNDSTTDLLLESAFFHSESISRTTRKFLINSDAGYRFERGVDYTLQETIIERATGLLLDIVGGEAGEVFLSVDQKALPIQAEIKLRTKRLERLLGYTIDDAQIHKILSGLGMQVEASDEGFKVTAPAYRFDITMEADLIEEVARIYGYDVIPEVLPKVDISNPESVGNALKNQLMRKLLAHFGYHEIISYSFVDKEIESEINDAINIALLNPVSQDLSVMRTSLWSSLIRTLQYNQNRQQERIRLFEVGLCYEQSGEILQEPKIAGLISGSRLPEQWGENNVPSDFYDIKHDVEMLLSHTTGISYRAAEHKALHPGQSAQIFKADKAIGWVGKLHPRLVNEYSLRHDAYLFEIDVKAINCINDVHYESVSKYPEIRRDLAFWVGDDISHDQLVDTIKAMHTDFLKDVFIFDIYQGENAPDGKKSCAMALILQHSSRTLIDEEVNTFIEGCVLSLQKECGAQLRD